MPVLHVTPRLRTLAFACKDKSCAPPPVGTGGSNSSGSAPAPQSGPHTASTGEEAFTKGVRNLREMTPPYITRIVEDYSHAGFNSINHYLRFDAMKYSESILGKREAGTEKASDQQYHDSLMEKEFDLVDRIPFLDEAFAGDNGPAVTLTAPVTVHRGLGMSVKDLDSLPDEFEDKGFVSTTLLRDKALGFSNAEWLTTSADRIGVVMNVRLPKGTKVVSGLVEIDGEFPEKELLLNRGTRFRRVGKPVIKTEEFRGKQVRFAEIDVEVVQ